LELEGGEGDLGVEEGFDRAGIGDLGLFDEAQDDTLDGLPAEGDDD
jgi:hypothetical protein